MDTELQDELQYQEAVKRVKKIKSFYTHLAVYIIINIMIAIVNYQDLDVGESYFQFQNFTTLTFWGIGLLAHGLSTFLPAAVLGSDWEERKIKEIMEKNKQNKWQ